MVDQEERYLNLDRAPDRCRPGIAKISRMNDLSEKLYAAMEVKDREIAELRSRIEAIEQRNLLS